MRIVNINDVKTDFSKLIDAAINGNEILIAKAGKPVAKIVPINNKSERGFGLLKGKMKTTKDLG